MKTKMIISILCIGALTIISGCKNDKEVSLKNDAKVIFTIGDVTVKSMDAWKSAAEDMKLNEGSEIKTGKQAQCNIVIGKDSFVTVKEESHLILKTLFRDVSGMEDSTLELKIGSSVINPKKLLKGDSFKVKTPTAIAAVRGTQFVVESNPEGKMKVAVVKGKVELKRRIPVFESIEKDFIDRSDALTSLKEKVEEESIVVDANQSAFIDNRKAEEENKKVEEVVEKHIKEIKKIEVTQEKSEQAGEIQPDEIRVAEKNNELKKVDKSTKTAISALEIMKKEKNEIKQIKLSKKVEEKDRKDVEELEKIIIKIRKEQAEKKVKEETVAELAIVTEHEKGGIYVNSRFIGYKNVRINPLPDRKLKVEIKADGYATYKKEISLKPGEIRELKPELLQLATLQVTAPVKNSRIYINSKFAGKGTLKQSFAPGEKINVSIKSKDLKDYNSEIVLLPGENKTLKPVLERKKAYNRVKWTQKVGSEVSSNPVYFQNRLLIATNDGYLVSMNRGGKTLWKANLRKRVESTPVINRGRVYVVTNSGEFYSINVYTGRIQWKKKLFGALLFGAKPLLVKNNIYLATSYGRVYSFDRKGKELWKKDIENGIYTSTAYRDGKLFFGAEDYNIYALSVKDGELLWKFKTDSRMVSSSPVIVEKSLYIGCYSGRFYSINTENGDENWTYETDDSIFSTPLYMKKKIYFGSNDGTFYVLSSKSGKLLWKYNTGSKVKNPPVIKNGLVYVTSGSSLFALNQDSGKIQWKHTFTAGVKTSATAVGKDIFVGLDNGEVASVRNSLFDVY